MDGVADDEGIRRNSSLAALGALPTPFQPDGALLHHMRDNNMRYGLQPMREGCGMANATILELL